MIDVKQFLFSIPEKVAPEVVEGLSTLFHFDVADSGQYTVKLDNGKFEVSEGLTGEATCKVTASAETLSKILSGELNAQMAFFTGKLKITNLGEMMKYAKIFGLA
ncbi:MAG: SCP2 sterol-binding domain-containing protein [Saprospiraceae bacterium]